MKIEFIDRSLAGFDEEKEKSLLARINEKGIKIGSLLFAKSGKIFYEKYFGIADCGRGVDIPNSEYTLSRMFSICKSFTSIAIGLLIDEGRISLTDRIVEYYTLLTGIDIKNAVYDEGVSNTTIEDMLTMRTSHTKTTYKVNLSKNWVESFFSIPSDKKPGETFNYDTSASHVLCALVEKMTGMDMLTYIKRKMPELGLSDESYIIRDPFGISTGGSGLMCTTRDLFRFAYLISNKGRILSDKESLSDKKNEGEIRYKQLISSEYIINAVSNKIDVPIVGQFPFKATGYGYYFWKVENDGYLCYGMNGQFIYFLPDKDMILIATSDCSDVEGGEQALLNLLWNNVTK